MSDWPGIQPQQCTNFGKFPGSARLQSPTGPVRKWRKNRSRKAGIRWSGLSVGETTAPKCATCLYMQLMKDKELLKIQINKEVELVCALEWRVAYFSRNSLCVGSVTNQGKEAWWEFSAHHQQLCAYTKEALLSSWASPVLNNTLRTLLTLQWVEQVQAAPDFLLPRSLTSVPQLPLFGQSSSGWWRVEGHQEIVFSLHYPCLWDGNVA